jgi:hypothetical protein
VLSLLGNTCGVIVVNNHGLSHVVSIQLKSQAGNALTECFEDNGVPTILYTAGVKEFTKGCWQEILTEHGGIKQTIAEPCSH